MSNRYAVIKDNLVVNVILFDTPSQETLDFFIQDLNVDKIIPCPEKCAPKFTWDGSKFISPQYFLSWSYDEEINDWVPPTPKPDDGKRYGWDEPTLSWKEVLFPII
jgi:hypothetical protein